MAKSQTPTPIRIPNPFIVFAAAIGIVVYVVFIAALVSVAILAWLFEEIGGQNKNYR
ncbi:hypothetical protein FHT93_004127 [Rhizobium sp. BK379]|jgi:hypothetical protein|nr:hypothetical protein [Rhizobium sp. BK379]